MSSPLDKAIAYVENALTCGGVKAVVNENSYERGHRSGLNHALNAMKAERDKADTQPPMSGEDTRAALVTAAERADWMQVVLNQGPPCFHIEGDTFCLRAERWFGHHCAEPDHKFVSLADLLREAASRLAAPDQATLRVAVRRLRNQMHSHFSNLPSSYAKGQAMAALEDCIAEIAPGHCECYGSRDCSHGSASRLAAPVGENGQRCNGCGHQWSGSALVVLCGDCWWKTWPFIWRGVNADAAAPRPVAEPEGLGRERERSGLIQAALEITSPVPPPPPAEAREEPQSCGQCECCAAWRQTNDALRAQVQTLTEERDKAQQALAEAAHEINCAGPVAHRIRVLKLEHVGEMAMAWQQAKAALIAAVEQMEPDVPDSNAKYRRRWRRVINRVLAALQAVTPTQEKP